MRHALLLALPLVRPCSRHAAEPAPPAASRRPTSAAATTAAGRRRPPAAARHRSTCAKLRADYDRLRDAALSLARARAELVEEGAVRVASSGAPASRWKGAPDFVLRRAEVRLDGEHRSGTRATSR